MSKKRYDDEAPRRKALELRRLGISYREIAKDVRRLKSMATDQSIKIRDIEAKIGELKAKQRELDNSIFMLGADFISELEKLKAKLNKLASQLHPNSIRSTC